MKKHNGKLRFLYFLIGSIGLCAILLGVAFGTALLHPDAGGAHAHSANRTSVQKMQAGVLPMRPMFKMAVKMAALANNNVPCLNNTTPPLCYSPQQLRQAYAIQPLLNAGITGKGRIITLIDAFQDPTVQSDLHLFDQLFGLNDPQLNILTPFGTTPFNAQDPVQTGFAGEIALDVEWAHAMAPDATIDLVLANPKNNTVQGQLTALLQATQFAVQSNIGSVISQSFGAGETCLGKTFIQAEHQIFAQARAQQQTVFASAGDKGSAVIQCDANGQPVTLAQGVNYPASDPLVTAVGGTTLQASKAGNYISETAWNESQQGAGATGGGVSAIFPQPLFQQNIVNSANRAASDLSFDADPLTGVPVVTSSLMPGNTMVIPIGGTSLGAPAAAAMTALFTQMQGKRLGFLNSAFYRISQNNTAYAQAFHDVQTGNNTFPFQNGNANVVTVPGFNATIGWDPPTGVGTPNAANLATLLPQFIQAGDGVGL